MSSLGASAKPVRVLLPAAAPWRDCVRSTRISARNSPRSSDPLPSASNMRNAAVMSVRGMARSVTKKMNSANETRPSPSTSNFLKKSGCANAEREAEAADAAAAAPAPGSPGSAPERSDAAP